LILSFLSQETLRQRGKFGLIIIRLPRDTTVRQDFANHAVQGAFEGFDAIAGFEIGNLRQRNDSLGNGLAIQNAGDIMGRKRGCLAPPSPREFRE
jgi:hypothetical protein